MPHFNPSSFTPFVAELLFRPEPCELGPGRPRREMANKLRNMSDTALFGERPVVDRQMALCCQSGLWLLHDFLDESHQLSQDIETDSGSYWHGIMHRREPDFSNAKYWFRRVGKHAVFPAILAAGREQIEVPPPPIAKLLQPAEWDPFRFVDLCEQASQTGGTLASACQQLAQIEWQILFEHCYDVAIQG